MVKRVFVSDCYDLLHSGHVEFFKQASQYGDLYVCIGSDATFLEYKHRKPMFPQEERLFMVQSIKYVKDACINEGNSVIDFLPSLDKYQPDIFVVNKEGGSDDKRPQITFGNILFPWFQIQVVPICGTRFDSLLRHKKTSIL